MSTGSKQTSTTTTDPAQLALLTGNYNAAKPLAATLSQPYTGSLVAPNSSGQLAAQQGYTDIFNNNVGAAPLQSAMDTTSGYLNFNPSQVSSNYSPTSVAGNYSPAHVSSNYQPFMIGGNYSVPQISSNYAPAQIANNYTPTNISANPIFAGQLSKTDLAPYTNPFTKDVINTTVAQNERARQMAAVNDNQRATAANAFGGSRQAVADSLTNQAYDQNSASLIAGLNSANFTQAQAGATGDLNRNLQADTTNQGANLAAAQSNQTAGYNAANLGFGIAKANQDAGFNAANLNQSAMIANQGAGLTLAQLLQAAKIANQGASFNAANLNQQGEVANQNAGLTAAQLAQAARIADQNAGFNAASLNQSGQVANQNAGITAANLGLSAATNLAGYSQDQLNQAGQRAGFMSSVGDAQQAQQQAELTAQYQEFIRQLTGSAQGQQILNQALGTFPNQQTTTQTGQQSALGGIFGALGGIGGGLLSSPAAGTAIFGA